MEILDKKAAWAQVSLRREVLTMQIARTLSDKSRGLMNRQSLGRNEGMLFVFGAEWWHVFWMKNVKIPLDLIYLDKNFKIVEIAAKQQPCKGLFCPPIIPKAKSKYVIEVNAGTAERLNLWIGDQAHIEAA